MEQETKRCPYCGEEILAVAKKCKHCGEWLEKETIRPERIDKKDTEQNSNRSSKDDNDPTVVENQFPKIETKSKMASIILVIALLLAVVSFKWIVRSCVEDNATKNHKEYNINKEAAEKLYNASKDAELKKLDDFKDDKGGN